MLLVVGLVAVLVANGSSPLVISPPSGGAAPGHDSPFAAVAGFVDGDNQSSMTLACQYIVPYQQSQCLRFPPDGEQVSGFRLGSAVIVGSQALVTVLSTRWCISQDCIVNADPTAGLPTSAGEFAAEFQYSLTHNSDPTINGEEIDGKWYVKDSLPVNG